MPNPSELQIKEQMCEVGRRIWARGFCAGNAGNHSVRVGPDRFLCTPSGLSKGFLSPQDICVVDATGRSIEPNPRSHKPSSEILLHLAIYRKRGDISAVVHSHPPHATAFAIANLPVPEGIHPEAEVFLGKVRIAPYATPSTEDLPQSVEPLIGSHTSTILLGNHGSVSFSDDLMDAYYRLEILDAYCRVLILAMPLRQINVLSADQMKELLQVKRKFGFEDERTGAEEGIGQDNEPFVSKLDG